MDSNAAVRKYVWQPETLDRDVPLTVYDAASERTYYFHTGMNKNVTGLSDDSGNIVAYYEYYPFGFLIKVTGDYAGSNPFRFSSCHSLGKIKAQKIPAVKDRIAENKKIVGHFCLIRNVLSSSNGCKLINHGHISVNLLPL